MSAIKQFFKGFKNGMGDFGQNISIIINTVLLTVVYFVAVALTAITAKLTGKRFLDERIDDRKTYWTELNLKKEDIEKYYRQF